MRGITPVNALCAALHKMVKHTQTIRHLLLTNCLSVHDHFVGLALKELNCSKIYHMLSSHLIYSLWFLTIHHHYAKSVQMQSFFWPVFSRISKFSPNAVKYGPEKKSVIRHFSPVRIYIY